MKTRVLTAVVALPLLLAVLFVLPWKWPTALLIAACCAIAVWELCAQTGLCRHRGMQLASSLMALCVIFYSWAQGQSDGALRVQIPAVAVYAALFLYILALLCMLLRAHAQLPFTALCVALFAGLVIPWLLGAVVRLRMLEYGRTYLGAALILAMTADTGAYFAGRAFGKHKLAPVISPKKTVEGAIGGILSTVLFMLLYCLLLHKLGGLTVHYGRAVLYGVVGASLSIVGDLSFSVVKRQVGIKDYGKLLPGHGGILDRFDSMLTVAPLTELLALLLPLVG